MINILIQKQGEVDGGWVFEVSVADGSGEVKYKVFVPRDYWENLTGSSITPEELVKKSFEFLLSREPKESILKEFSLPLIQKYFPEYEQEIKRVKR